MIGTRTYTQHIDCRHKAWLANPGIMMCNAGHGLSCETCPYKESKDIEVTESWASTESASVEEPELYYDPASGKLINFEP